MSIFAPMINLLSTQSGRFGRLLDPVPAVTFSASLKRSWPSLYMRDQLRNQQETSRDASKKPFLAGLATGLFFALIITVFFLVARSGPEVAPEVEVPVAFDASPDDPPEPLLPEVRPLPSPSESPLAYSKEPDGGAISEPDPGAISPSLPATGEEGEWSGGFPVLGDEKGNGVPDIGVAGIIAPDTAAASGGPDGPVLYGFGQEPVPVTPLSAREETPGPVALPVTVPVEIPAIRSPGHSSGRAATGAIAYEPGEGPPRGNEAVTLHPKTWKKKSPIEPGPILAMLWQGKPTEAQRQLDEKQARGHVLERDSHILLADLIPAMAAQKNGHWELAVTRYRNARANAVPFKRAVRDHIDLLFWLSFAMLRHTEKDRANAVENLEFARPELIPGMTAFERDFYRRTAMAIMGPVAGGQAEKDTRTAPATAPATGPAPGSDKKEETPPIPEMVSVSAGRFRMGDIQGGGYADELPVHEVKIAHTFAVGRYEITNREYVAFLNSARPRDRILERWIRIKRKEPLSRIEKTADGYRVTADYARYPVTHVSWFGATAYAKWLSGKTGKQYRLPTEAEWEYVARAGTPTRYWWGNDFGQGKANCNGCNGQPDSRGTVPVGTFSANPFGLHDVHGNVWEWVQDCSDGSGYRSTPRDGSARERRKCKSRIIRGGGWDYKPWYARSAARFRFLPSSRHRAVGFRLVLVSRT